MILFSSQSILSWNKPLHKAKQQQQKNLSNILRILSFLLMTEEKKNKRGTSKSGHTSKAFLKFIQ